MQFTFRVQKEKKTRVAIYIYREKNILGRNLHRKGSTGRVKLQSLCKIILYRNINLAHIHV
jgi:hypothetical protein